MIYSLKYICQEMNGQNHHFLTGFFPKYRCLSWRNFALLFRFFWVTYFLDDLLHLIDFVSGPCQFWHEWSHPFHSWTPSWAMHFQYSVRVAQYGGFTMGVGDCAGDWTAAFGAMHHFLQAWFLTKHVHSIGSCVNQISVARWSIQNHEIQARVRD